MKTIFLKLIQKAVFASLAILVMYSNSFSQVVITSGTKVTTTGNVQIVIADLNFSNYGTLNASASTFVFSGSASNTLTGNGAFITFDNLTINKTAGKLLTLNGSLNVNGKVNFVSGDIELNNQTIDLKSTGSFNGESEISRVTGINGGQVKASATLNAPNAANIANLGAVLTSAANMGTVSVIRKHQPINIAGAADKSVNRSFEFSAGNNAGLNAALTIKYFDKELNGITETELAQYQTTDNINYLNKKYSARSSASNYVTQTSYGSLGKFTLSSASSLQPVKCTDTVHSGNRENSFAAKEDFYKAKEFKVMPNPVIDVAKVAVSARVNTKGTLLLFNVSGQQVMQQQVAILPGINQYQLNMQGLAKGIYSLVFHQPGDPAQIIQIIKQ